MTHVNTSTINEVMRVGQPSPTINKFTIIHTHLGNRSTVKSEAPEEYNKLNDSILQQISAQGPLYIMK